MPEYMWSVYPWVHLSGRVLFSLFCILFGLMHMFGSGVPAYLQEKGIPGPKVVSAAMGLMMLVGGVFILLGWHRFIGGGLVFLAMFPAGWALHPFWKEQDPTKRLHLMSHFFNALAIAGGALLVAYYGGAYWPLSLGH
jgi:putative oxidoreductase